MILKFIKMQLNNFMSFETASISFDNSGYTIISGENKNPSDCASSNGSGKSSIWEALCWVLTGDTIRGCKNIQNIYSKSKETSVTVEFEIDNHYYKVERIKDSTKSNMRIVVDGVDKSGKGIREGETILSNLLPDLTPDLLGSVILLGQGLPCRLSSKTPAGRKELLEKLTHSDFMIEDIKSRLSKRKQYLSENENSLNNQRDIEYMLVSKYDTEILELKNKEEVDIAEYETTLNHITQQRNQLQNIIIDIKRAVEDIEKGKKSILDKIFELKLQESNITQSIESKYSADIDSVTDQISLLKATYGVKKESLKNLLSTPDICPTCGHKMDKPVENIDAMRLEIEKVSEQIQFCERNLNNIKLQREEEVKTRLASLRQEISLQRALFDSKNQESLQVSVEKEKSERELEKVTADFYQMDAFIKTYKTSIADRDKKIKDLEGKIKSSQDKILYYNSEIADIEGRLDAVNKMITLSNRDFRGYLLSDIISYMDSVMKHYGEIVFNHNNIDFKLGGNSLDIIYCDKYYESLSGGERQKIDLIVQFALRKMLTNLFGFSANILVLDEIFDAMDADSCQKVINFIASELTDVESVYLITHHQELQIPYDHEIRVVKDKDNISRIY